MNFACLMLNVDKFWCNISVLFNIRGDYMNYLKNHKIKLLLYLFISASVLLAVRIIFFLPDTASRLVENILFDIIAVICLGIVLLMILPVKMTFKAFFMKYRDIFLFTAFFLILESSLIFKNNLNYSTITLFSIIFSLSIFVIILLIIPKNVKLVLILISFIAFPIYVGAQDDYYRIFNEFFSFKDAVSLGSGLEFATGISLFKFYQYFLIVFSILSIFILFYIKIDNRIKINKKTAKIFFVPILFFILIHLNAVYPITTARLYISDDYLFISDYSHNKFIARFGALNYLVRDVFDTVIPKEANKKDLATIDDYFSTHEKDHPDNDYTDIFKNKNLIFIQAESLDSIAINDTLTPNIEKLMNEGINFENNYIPVYPRTTCDTEIIYNTSIIPSVTDGPTCYMFNKNSYSDSLASLFNNQEYETNAFHGNYKEFYTRSDVYKGLEYQNFYGQEELGLTDAEKRFDSIFFEKSKDIMIKDDSKFFSYLITLSGHSPYTTDNTASDAHIDEVNAYYGNSIPQEVKEYIAAEMEVDLLVGEVLDTLQEKGLLDDTVIVLAADHYPYTMDSTVYDNYKGISEEYLKNKSPFVIWANGIEHQDVTKLTSSFDVLPTLANMFGLNANYTDYFGNDIFSDNYTPIIFYKDYSWFDGTNYVSDGILKTGTADEEYVNQMTQMVNDYFNISIEILRTNYYKVK